MASRRLVLVLPLQRAVACRKRLRIFIQPVQPIQIVILHVARDSSGTSNALSVCAAGLDHGHRGLSRAHPLAAGRGYMRC